MFKYLTNLKSKKRKEKNKKKNTKSKLVVYSMCVGFKFNNFFANVCNENYDGSCIRFK